MHPTLRTGPTRRSFALGAGVLYAWAHVPAFAETTRGRDPRLLVILLRGGLDGLSAVAPLGDPDYLALRESIALRPDGEHPALPLDGFFFLHPAMPETARLFRERKLSVVHAVATPYRDRSHFDAQDTLESGGERPRALKTGWLNRLLGQLPSGSALRSPASGLAVGLTTPLIMRGEAPILAWAPPVLQAAPQNLYDRMIELYAHTDPDLAKALYRSLETERLAAGSGLGGPGSRNENLVEACRSIASGAARFLARPDGPRVAALSLDGFDTHANAGGATGRLASLLAGLDAAFQALEVELAPVWRDTAVVVVTEFGRAAQLNGTHGTDHGNGTVAFLTGGAVRGGRVIADWPGLAPKHLLDGRDLLPTTDLRAVLGGIASDLLDLPRGVLARDIFPGTEHVAPLRGLVA